MRDHTPDILEKHRLRKGDPKAGPYGTTEAEGLMGCFEGLRRRNDHFARKLRILSSGPKLPDDDLDGDPALGWEHVSVSIMGKNASKLTPTWEDMAFVKSLFWTDEETVMQLHVPSGDHVSMHDGTLHLWRPTQEKIPRPPTSTVGVPGLSSQQVKQLLGTGR